MCLSVSHVWYVMQHTSDLCVVKKSSETKAKQSLSIRYALTHRRAKMDLRQMRQAELPQWNIFRFSTCPYRNTRNVFCLNPVIWGSGVVACFGECTVWPCSSTYFYSSIIYYYACCMLTCNIRHIAYGLICLKRFIGATSQARNSFLIVNRLNESCRR